MATRRMCREWVVQLLFQLDLNPNEQLPQVFKLFWKGRRTDRASREFTEVRVRGVQANRQEIDARIRRLATNWALERMGVVDRNVLRLACYELEHCPDVPPAVVINEAVDVAKYFSNAESGRFVNGILDQARKEREPSRTPAGGEGA